MEKYLREFKQLQMWVRLDEEPELKIARFIKGLLPNIANKVDLQPYLSFDNVCHQAIKVEKQLKGRKSFQTTSSIHPSSTPKGLLHPQHSYHYPYTLQNPLPS